MATLEYIRENLANNRFNSFDYGSDKRWEQVNESKWNLCAPFTPYFLGIANEKVNNRDEAALFFEIMAGRTPPSGMKVDVAEFSQFSDDAYQRLNWLHIQDLIGDLEQALR